MFNPTPKAMLKFKKLVIDFVNFEVLVEHRLGTTNLMSKLELFFIIFYV